MTGVQAWFGLKYAEHENEIAQIFDMSTSDMSYEDIVQSYGFGLAPIKTQGSGTAYDSHAQGFIARFTHVAYSLGYIVAREELADNKYGPTSMDRAGALAFSMSQTRQNVGANVLNRGYNSSYLGGDGVELYSASHPLALGGTFSNLLSPAADFSEASLEDLCIQIMDVLNPRGLKVSIMPKRLIIPTQLAFEAERVLKSTLQNDSANGAINALRSKSVIPEYVVNHYLTDTDAFHIKTNAPKGLIWMDREPVEFKQDTDFDSDNAKAKAYMRFVAYWADPRGAFSSQGA